MKLPHLVPLAAVFVTTLCATARADDKDAIVAAEKATHDAPAYRMTATSTDGTTKAVTTLTAEVVSPETMHLKSEMGGKPQMEMFSDGQKMFISSAGGPMQAAPPQMADMMKQMRAQFTGDAMAKLAQNVKLVGHEDIGGVPTSVYTFEADMMGMHALSKEWISDKDHRPLKVESGAKGNVAGKVVDQSTSMTFDYDPSIKVTMPKL